jgi:hypothetical protein
MSALPPDPDAAAQFYVQVLQTLAAEQIPCMVGGAYAFAHYTGIRRPTKDLDVFVRQSDWERLSAAAARAGHRAELTFPHWLGKVHDGGGAGFVDVIFNAGNGLSPVEDSWFDHAVPAHVLGQPALLTPVEETLWTKAFIMERERYDGADVVHLVHACAARIDWQRLLMRFGEHWRVLLSHLVLFGFIYPGERDRVPRWLMNELAQRLAEETRGEAPRTDHCAGTLLSREQYLPDVAQRGYHDARLSDGSMTEDDVATWTAAIGESS